MNVIDRRLVLASLCTVCVITYAGLATPAQTRHQVQTRLHDAQQDPDEFLDLPAQQDAYVADGAAWRSEALGTRRGLYVGYDGLDDVGHTESLLRFDLASAGFPSGARITGARLALYLVYATFSRAQPDLEINLHPLRGAWSEDSVRWVSKPPMDPASAVQTHRPIAVDGTVDRLVTWDIDPTVVKAWIENPDSNHGLVLRVPDGANPGRHLRGFMSREGGRPPRLRVSYTIPTATALPTATPTPTPRKAAGLSLNSTVEPGVVRAGTVITYVLDYANTGELDLERVDIFSDIPERTELIGSRPEGILIAPEEGSSVYRLLWSLRVWPVADSGRVEYYVRVLPEDAATPEPTSTPSVQPTGSITITVPATSTSTPTATASPTGTNTPSITPSPSLTPDPSIPPTATATPTITPDPNVPPTETSTPTITPTATITPSPTGSPTASPTHTVTASPTSSPTSPPTVPPATSTPEPTIPAPDWILACAGVYTLEIGSQEPELLTQNCDSIGGGEPLYMPFLLREWGVNQDADAEVRFDALVPPWPFR